MLLPLSPRLDPLPEMAPSPATSLPALYGPPTFTLFSCLALTPPQAPATEPDHSQGLQEGELPPAQVVYFQSNTRRLGKWLTAGGGGGGVDIYYLSQ